jgi:hypothetical protein
MATRGRVAAVALVARGADRTRTLGVQLLSDLRDVFASSDKLATSCILEQLHNLPESAWKDIRGKPLDERGLAWRLKKYGVKPKRLRLHGESFLRGYEAADLRDLWIRYLSPPEEAPHAPRTSHPHLSATKTSTENSQKCGGVAGVADVALPEGIEGDSDPFATLRDPSLLPKRRSAS